METRRFGRTELDMPVLSCGGMRYQHSWADATDSEIPAAGQANLEATIRRAFDLGIRHIETARGYGSSELQLGKILPRLPREQLIVQTKIAPRDDAEEFAEAFERSISLLGTGYVDLLSLHGINTSELLEVSMRKGGCLDVCRRLQREGRVRFVGFSTHGPTRVIVDAIETGEFDYVNLHWYWVNQTNWPAIQAAKARDLGVFIISPSDKGGMLHRPPEKLADLCAPLSPMAFNDLFCLSHPEVHTLSLGAARPSDFDDHVQAVGMLGKPATHGMVLEIEIRLSRELRRVLGADWMDSWETGLPPWWEIPGEINIREILRLRNLAVGLDMVEFAKMRYNMMPNGGHWVPGNIAADFDDAEIERALAASPFAASIPGLLRETHQLLFDQPGERLSTGD